MLEVAPLTLIVTSILAFSAIVQADTKTGWANALKPKGKAGAEITLASRGKTDYRILLAASPTSQDRKAAEDLKRWLDEMTGADFQTQIEDQAAKRGKIISLGRTHGIENLPGSDADLGRDGYAILQNGDSLFLIGGTRRGPINAVYALLEEDLGCRWYDRSSSQIPHMPDLKFRPVPRKYVPVLDIRDPFYWDAFETDWSVRNRTIAPWVAVPEEWGGTTNYAWFGHAFDWLVPPEEYFATHPEYFAERNGKRGRGQLCLSNPDVLKISVAKIKELLRTKPNAEIVSIAQNDCRGYCECAECKPINDAEGTFAAPIVLFINAIGDAIKDESPNVKVSTLAYMDATEAPKTIKPRDNVIIQLCTDRHAWRNPFLAQPETQRFQKALEGWHRLGSNISIWDYTTNYHHYPIIMPNYQVVESDIENLIKNGASGIMLQGSHLSPGGDNGPMRAWVWGKKLWDPSLRSKDLMRDFVFGYYGEAAKPMWAYTELLWDTWERNHSKPKDQNLMFCGIRYYPDSMFLDGPHLLDKALGLFAEAEGLATNRDTKRRVTLAKFALLYSKISQEVGFVDYYKKFQPRVKRGPSDLTRQTLLVDEFAAIAKAEGITHISEGNPDLDRKVEQLRYALANDLSGSVIELSNNWQVKADPNEVGVTQEWFASEYSASDWTDTPGVGVSWSRQKFDVPADLAEYTHAYLWFDAVGDEAEVYLNGKRAFEHSYESTALPWADLRHRPFFFDARQFLNAGSNLLVIRARSLGSPSGVWKPVKLVLTDHEDLPRMP